jgi:PAS domain S-box-containing protein
MTEKLPHILLVHSSPEDRRVLCESLEPVAARLTVVATGLEAIEALHHSAVDLLITDINIGEFDCWRLARIIRSGIYLSKATLPIIIITRIWCERITEITARDFDINHLLAFDHHQQLAQLAGEALQSPGEGLRLPRVLVVEDHVDNARLVNRILQHRFQVELAHEGLTGLESWGRSRHELVLLDVMLPGMSGGEVLDKILEINPQQPVVIMTAHGTMDLAEQMMIRGAVDFISKPFRAEQLRRVCELAARREDYLVSNAQFAARLENLQQLQQQLSSIIDSMPSILISVDREGRVTQWNHEAERVFDCSFAEAVGEPLEKFSQGFVDLDAVRQAMDINRIWVRSKLPLRCEDKTIYIDQTIYPLFDQKVTGAVIRIDDVTKRVKLEERILQSEKMSSLGQLAAGMANEINNPLAGIMQNMQVVCNRLNVNLGKNLEAARRCGVDLENLACYLEDREITSRLEAVMESGARAAQLVEGMLGFSNQGSTYSRVPTRLDDLIDKALYLAASHFSLKRKFDFRAINISRDYLPLGPVHCDSVQMQQVILSLLMNGAAAMEQKTLELPATERNSYQPQFVVRISEAEGLARLDIEDNGAGIENEMLGRIFEPFFSTRQTGEGFGLGLSLAYYIVTEGHRGQMQVSSTPGLGTQFTILLPLSENRG